MIAPVRAAIAIACVACVACIALVAGVAHAAPPPGAPPARAPAAPAPAASVPAAPAVDTPAQREARALFAQANQRFEQNDFVGAVALYEDALARWDRPVIRFNLAVALIELDRSREAFTHLERALGPGHEELGPRVVEARNYLRLVRRRLSTLVLHHDAATACEIDGAPAPGPGRPLVLEPGSHTLVAHKPGFETWSRPIVLEPGATREVTVVLDRPRTRLVRRWDSSRPWLVAGGGAALALAGGASLALGNAGMATANAELRARCVAPCAGVPTDIARQVDDARLAQRLGAVGLAVGGAAILSGLVLVYLNQPRVAPALDVPPVAVEASAGRVVLHVGGTL